MTPSSLTSQLDGSGGDAIMLSAVCLAVLCHPWVSSQIIGRWGRGWRGWRGYRAVSGLSTATCVAAEMDFCAPVLKSQLSRPSRREWMDAAGCCCGWHGGKLLFVSNAAWFGKNSWNIGIWERGKRFHFNKIIYDTKLSRWEKDQMAEGLKSKITFIYLFMYKEICPLVVIRLSTTVAG